MNLTFNPEYVLKIEKGSVLLMPKENIIQSSSLSDSNFFMRIHSIHAAILSFFDGRKTEDAFEAAAKFLNISTQTVNSFIERIVNNEERIGANFKGMLIQFPKKCLIYTDKKRAENYEPLSFDFSEVQLVLRRHQSPTDITIMVNTRCATDCVYCYADRRKLIDCQIPMERLKEIIREARSLQVRSVDVIGGEFFLYKEWKELLMYLKEFGYDPFISTKVPIDEDTIKALKEIGVKGLQISLDTLNKENIIALLKVKPKYVEKIKETIRLVDKYGIKLYIHTIVTGINDTYKDAASVYEFIKDLKNLDSWRLDLPASSQYKSRENFEKIVKPKKENVDILISYLDKIIENDKPGFDITYNIAITPIIDNDDIEVAASVKAAMASRFEERSFCSANFSSMFILPDGKVTICEELYWNNRYIIGNVLEQGLQEIWDSEKSYKQYYIEQKDIPEDSACSTCNEFEECRRGQGVCYRDVIKSFGADKWYYPDRNCPKAPKPLYEISV